MVKNIKYTIHFNLGVVYSLYKIRIFAPESHPHREVNAHNLNVCACLTPNKNWGLAARCVFRLFEHEYIIYRAILGCFFFRIYMRVMTHRHDSDVVDISNIYNF